MIFGIIVTAVVIFGAMIVWALVPTLVQLRRTAAALEEVAVKIKGQIDPTLHEAQTLVRDVSSLARRVDTDMKVVSRIVEDVSETTGYARDLASLVKEQIERPILGLVSTVMGLKQGAQAFRSYRERKKAPRNPLRKVNDLGEQ
ncbi:MAG: DUF948 domain-containing protein [Acidobacteriota bacterium]